MVVDCHSHIWSAAEHIREDVLPQAGASKSGGVTMDFTMEDHITAMEPVERAVVFGLRANHAGIVVPDGYVAEYVSRHPKKLIGFASLDPAMGEGVEELERAVSDLKLRGLKLGPMYQNIHPMDERLQPVYRFCQERRLPILFHMGTNPLRQCPIKFTLPTLLDEVAIAFPDLVMVMAHLGHPWERDALVTIRKHPNLYGDISALHYRPWEFYNTMVHAMEWGVAHKLLFGSDFPWSTPGATMEALRNINAMTAGTNLPKIPDEVVRGIIERDTLEVLGLK